MTCRLRSLLLFLGLLASLAAPLATQAQEQDETKATAVSTDPLRRDSPRRFQIGLIDAMMASDPGLLVNYLELDNPESEAARRKALAFKAALDAHGILPNKISLSVEPGGKLEDGLPPDQEEIARIAFDSGEIPVIARHVENEDGKAIWLVSAETLAQIPDLPPEEAENTATPGQEDDLHLFGAPLRNWAVLLAVALAIYTAIIVLLRLFDRWILHGNQSPRRATLAHLIWAFAHPAALYFVYMAISRLAEPLGAGVIETTVLKRTSSLVGWVAIVWLIWRLIGALHDRAAAYLRRNGMVTQLGLVNFTGRLLRLTVLVVALGVLLATFGIDVTAGLAALGIGGLALALGARKAMEDLVGSIVVLADHPVRIGDTCRIDGIIGDVVDIGMRSTQLRTRNRTMLTIPNSQFADSKIENLTARDSFLIDQTFLLALTLDADSIARALSGVREVLEASPDTIPSTCPVRFRGFSESTFAIQIFCRIECDSYAEGYLRQERILLDVMRRLGASGIAFALPARHLETTGVQA